MSYKQYVRGLEQQLEAYNFFADESLELLKVSVDLGIVHTELWDRAQKFKGRDGYDELMEFVNKLSDAKQGFDTMYSRYNLAIRRFDRLRKHTLGLADLVMKYEHEEELANKEITIEANDTQNTMGQQ